jgi:hypothetical protein
MMNQNISKNGNEILDEKRRRTGAQILAMHKIIDETGWPVYYKTDFTEHDVATLNQLMPREFIWSIRETGTDIFILDVPHNDFLADAEWFMGSYKNRGEKNIRSYLFIDATPIPITKETGLTLIHNSVAQKARRAPIPVGSPVIYSHNGFIIGKWEAGILEYNLPDYWGVRRDGYTNVDWIKKTNGKLYRDFDKERK